MNATEKAYFKKYAFKKKNVNNDSYKRIFDVLDKQKGFNLNKLLSDKKINTSLKKNIKANLSNLHKRIVSSLLEYRKESDNLSILFSMFLEYNLYLEKGLNSLAKKKIEKAVIYAKEKNIYYQMPQLAYWQFRYLRGNIVINKERLQKKSQLLIQSIEDIQNISQSEIITLKLEMIIHTNKGLIINNEKDKRSLAVLVLQTEELLEDLEENFQLYSVLTSNMFIMNLMLGRIRNIDKMSTSFVSFYRDKITKTKSNGTKYDNLIYLKNLCVVHSHFGNKKLFDLCLKVIEDEYSSLTNESLRNRMKNNILYLKILYKSINEDDFKDVSLLNKAVETFKNENKKKIYYFEFLLPILVLKLKIKEYKKIINLSTELINDGFNNRSRDSYLSIRILRAITWLKLENLQMFDYEITSTYKYLLKNKGFYFNLTIINFLKRFIKCKTNNEKKVLFLKLIKEFDLVLENGTGTEKMKAIELKTILSLAL